MRAKKTPESFLDNHFTSQVSIEDTTSKIIQKAKEYAKDLSENVGDELGKEFVKFTDENHDTIVEYTTKAVTIISIGFAAWNLYNKLNTCQTKQEE